MYCYNLIALLALSAPVHASAFYQTISRPHHNLERPGIHLRTDTSVNVSGTDRVASGWYAGWLHDIPNIPWLQYNAVTFAFALTTDDPTNVTVSPDPSSLSQFVVAARVNVSLSLLAATFQEGKELILTAAVGLTPFSGMPSVAEFAKVLDYIAIMAYDVWGAGWSNTVGPNAPLYDSGMPLRMGSTASAVTAWTSLGFPANQASVAAYGRSYIRKNLLA
ncbi:hypothetical protein C8J57DRAFT_1608567 [Mycena rebaudengoi]|nr:hypothetical protein C8J57DRAFT_1608567 [Mycena rebaudengoi]